MVQQMTQDEVNDYLGGLLKDQGKTLDGIEGTILANFRSANGELAQKSQALQNAKSELERIQGAIQQISTELQKSVGNVEALAKILTEAESARRCSVIPEPELEPDQAPAEVELPEKQAQTDDTTPSSSR